jgi:hypothetical protein
MTRAVLLMSICVAVATVTTASADIAAVGKYTTKDPLDTAFTASLAAVSKTGWTVRTSDRATGTIEAVRVYDSNEFSSLIASSSQQTDHVVIEVSFTYYDGFIGCCKPADYAKKYGKQLKVALPDLTVEIPKDTPPRRVRMPDVKHAETSRVGAGASSSGAGAGQVLTNEELVKLVGLDLGDEIVIAKIKNAPSVKLDVSTNALVALKKANVGSAVIAAMIERAAARERDDRSDRAGNAHTSESQSPPDPCSGVEMMGLYKEDMRPVSPLIVYFAKVRNSASAAKIVQVEWLDMYGQANRSSVQVGAGAIVTLQLAAQEPFQRQPINLRVTSCR